MNSLLVLILKTFRKAVIKIFGYKVVRRSLSDNNPETASLIIYNVLIANNACMIARLGSTELSCLKNYLGVINNKGKYWAYVKGVASPWWWDQKVINQMQQWSGFFPAEQRKIEQFCKLMLQDIPEVDILASWLTDEYLFEKELEHSYKIEFELLNPYFSQIPWTRALEGKKVLVVHPFAHTIQQQYKKRELLFKNNLLPVFELKTIKAVQSIAGIATPFSDWFAALDFMKDEIDNQDYDICLIGCGAYGFPLAAHVKRSGKKAVQLGGSLQLLFGIRGKRWEDPLYNSKYNYAALINENWVKPSEEEKPAGADIVEGACYW